MGKALRPKRLLFFVCLFLGLFLTFFTHDSLAADVFTLSKTLEDPNAGALYFYQGLNVGDFNQDGYQDLVICGKPTGGGNAYVYYGSASGISNSPDSTLSGIASKASFGVDSKVYDLNNDGYDDLIVHSDKYNSDTNNHVGKIFIWYGSNNFLSDPADFTYTGSVAEEYFAGYVETVDLNGDSYPELITGTILNNDSMRGRVDIWLGEETISGAPDYTINGENTGDKFYTLASGKFNDDGYDDLMVGAEGFSSSTGKIYVYYGGASFDTTVDIEVLGENAGDRFGKVNAVDLNNDGYDEALVGAWGYNSLKGRVYVYYGPNGIDDSADVEIGTTHDSCYLGIFLGSYSGSSSGKINTDEYNDLILSCYSANTETGELYLHYGGRSQISATPDLTFSGEETYSRFGATDNNADLNNNGYQDLVVTANRYQSWTGRVYAYWGGEELDTTAEQKMTGEAVDDTFGSKIVIGDFNNDGYQELILGGANRATSVGKIYLYNLVHGSPSLSFTGLSNVREASVNLSGSILNSGVNVGGVQYSIDSGGWQNCSCTTGAYDDVSESFSCSLGELAEGSHSLRLRSKTSDNVYMASSAYGTNSFTVDRTLPASFELISPGHLEYLSDPRPTFKWKAASVPDDRSGISHYKFEVKYQDGGGFIIDNIPPSGTANNETEKYIIKYEGFSDSDNTNNYISLQTKSSSFWGECEGKLKLGTNNWSVRAVDYAGNEREQARIVYFSSSPTPTPTRTLTPVSTPKIKPQSALETEIIKEEKIPAETEEEKEELELRGPTVEIKVLDEKSKPIKGAKVTLYSEPRVAYTDEQGVAVFTNVEKGEHQVLIAYQGQEGEQKINLEGEGIKEFHYTIQIKPTNPFLNLWIILVILSLLAVIFLLLFIILAIKRKKNVDS